MSERQVSRYVRGRRVALGEVGEAFVPQLHAPGIEGEVDWGEAWVVLGGRRTKVHLFHLRLCHSGAAFARRVSQRDPAGVVGGARGGVRVPRGRSRVGALRQPGIGGQAGPQGPPACRADRFVGLRSHFMLESQFTLVGLQGAHEKGGIEGEVGRFRRRHLVLVPDVASLADLNALLRLGCEHDLARRITGHHDTVGEALDRERPLLRSLPEPLQTAEQVTPRVDSKALVSVRQNRYSVPVALVGLRVTATIGRGRSRSRMAAARSPAMTVSLGASGPVPGLITTSSCSRASPPR